VKLFSVLRAAPDERGALLKDYLNDRAGRYLGKRGYTDVRARDAKREAWWWFQTRKAALSRRAGIRQGWGIVWPEAGRTELMPVEVPEAGPGEVTVGLAYSAVSAGTERAQYLQLPSADVHFPFRPGYSGAGVVVSTGRGVRHVRPGDRVAVRGAPHASVVTVPAAAAHPLPAGVDPAAAAFVQLGVIAGHGVAMARIERGQTVCVVGAGIVGGLAAQAALAAGAAAVAVVATSRRREDVMRAAGAQSFHVAGDTQAVESIEADVVIEASGNPDAVGTAIAAARDGGRIVLLGSPRGETKALDTGAIRGRGLRIVGAHISTLSKTSGGKAGFTEAAERFLAEVAAGRIDPERLVTAKVAPDAVSSLYRALGRGEGVVGALIDWHALPADERVARVPLVRLPRLAAEGADHMQAPLRRQLAPAAADGDPFAGARGMLRVGLVGCGDVAAQNASALRQAPNTELVGCFDTVAQLAEDIARSHGIGASRSYEELLARPEVDAIFLSVPHHLHAPLARQAMEAGKHVIVEKPPANDLAGALELRDTAAALGLGLTFCFPQRYSAVYRSVHELVEAGALGELHGTSIVYFADKTDLYWSGGFSGRSRSTWRSSRRDAGGGVLIMNVSHHIDLVRHMVGIEAESVVAAGGAVDRPGEVEDTVSVSIAYENGAIGTLAASSGRRGMGGGGAEIQLWGADGQILMGDKLRFYSERRVGGFRAGRWHVLERGERQSTRAVFVSRFATALATGSEPDITPDDGVAVQAFIEAVYRSMELGTRVLPQELIDSVPA
jgi:2-desacetyl-2-hydroxyethyl bacteriochlorophyllide A dehydrogenase